MLRISKGLAVLASAMVATVGMAVIAPSAHATAPTTVAGDVDSFKYGESGLVTIAVSRDTAGGQTEVYDDQVLLGTATMTNGRGELELAPKLFKPGTHQLRLEYLGDGFFEASSGTVTFVALKATATVKVRVADTIDRSEGGKARVRVVAPNDVPVRGQVELRVLNAKRSVTGRLVDGKVVLVLPRFPSVGKFTLSVKYLGSPLVHSAKTLVTVKVVR